LNNSITLVPKVTSPASVNDFRTISLLGGPIKLITKLLANKLECVITEVIHENQYGFIKQRSIHDSLRWVFQYNLHPCYTGKKEIIILKLEFKKAFDKVEHNFILEMMQRKGFLVKWVSSVTTILSSGIS
jgi:hypothetical protein